MTRMHHGDTDMGEPRPGPGLPSRSVGPGLGGQGPGAVGPRARGGLVPALALSVAVALLVVVAAAAAAGATAESADEPLPAGEGGLPAAAGVLESGSRFAALSAFRAGNRMVVRWVNSGPAAQSASVLSSTDEPGHWAVRDWRSWPMAATRGAEGGGEVWEAAVPVPSVSVPQVYGVRSVVVEGEARVSGLRVFRPERAGMTEPTSPFLGFIDGFEDGLEGWEGPAEVGREGAVTRSTNAWSGRWALRVEVPPGRGSVVVGTVRIRGWMLLEPGVSAVRLAVRTESGEGRLRLALHGHARTGQLAVYPVLEEPRVGPSWQRLEVPLGAFRGLLAGAVDWFSVQWVAESGLALLVDDVELELR